MAAMRRQKVKAENDPLSLFMSQSNLINEEEEEEVVEEKVIPNVTNKKNNPLLNSLAPEKPIEYEPPPREQTKAPKVEETVKNVVSKEDNSPSAPPLQKEPDLESPKVPKPIPKQENSIVKSPPAPASVFETEEDIFLKKAPGARGEDDIFGTNDGELSELKFISSKDKSSPNKLNENDSEDDEKVLHILVYNIY